MSTINGVFSCNSSSITDNVGPSVTSFKSTLDQVDGAVHSDTVAEASNNNPESPVVEEQTAVRRNKRRKRSKRSKEKRQDRLLKFHQKLVEVSGILPSRLMLEQTPKSNRVELNRRRLDFDMYVDSAPVLPAVPAVPLPVASIQAQAAAPPALSAGTQSYGSYSSFHTPPMQCSITPTWTGGCVGVTSTPGWPDARPVGDFDSNMSQSSHPYFGSSRGSPYHSSLSSSSQYCMGLFQFQSQPNPAVPAPLLGTPAYCFHCLQYG